MRSAIVIGAGPAGSTAAAVLASAGIDVTLIEQTRRGRDKVCGECLSPLGIEALERGGLAEVVQRLSPERVESASFTCGEATLRVRLARPMWGITRRCLDRALLEAAQAAGAKVCRPLSALEVVERASAASLPAVIARDLETNRIQRLEADVVLVADGKCALLGAKPRLTGELGIKAHFQSVAADPHEVAVFGLLGQYVGLAPVSDGDRVIWNLAAAVPVSRLRAVGGDHEALLAEMRRENAALDRALAGAGRIGSWLTCPLPRFGVRRRWPTGAIPLGNAAAALEPIGGEGMGLAIASAALAARFVLDGRTSPGELGQLRREFAALWGWRRVAWRSVALATSSPGLSRLVIRCATALPRNLRQGIESRVVRLVHRTSGHPACLA